MEPSLKIIVFDDDPTGSQTVHSCLLLLRWDVETLCLGLADSSPLLFILTNTRAHVAEDAARITREVCRNLKVAMTKGQSEATAKGQSETPATFDRQQYLIVSRSDSTLRGHFPLEPDVITAELGPFDAQFLVPAFLEGDRITLNSTHYLKEQEQLIPVHETEFAQDPLFAYRHSYLPDYIAEKTQGRILPDQVLRLTAAELFPSCQKQLMDLQNNRYCVVDASNQSDLNRFAQDILQVSTQGKRFLFRSAASLLTAFGHLPPQPIAAQNMGQTVQSSQPGVFIVGSYAQKTTTQLTALLQLPSVEGIEVDLHLLQSNENIGDDLKSHILVRIRSIRQQGGTPVVYTSRQALEFADLPEHLRFGSLVAGLFAEMVQQLPPDLGYLVSKGGMTSNKILTQGLNLSSVRLLGQILPGCCLVQTSENHNFPQLPIVLFPGNVGQSQDLVTIYQRLAVNPH